MCVFFKVIDEVVDPIFKDTQKNWNQSESLNHQKKRDLTAFPRHVSAQHFLSKHKIHIVLLFKTQLEVRIIERKI